VETATEDYFSCTANDYWDGTNDDVPGGFMLEGLNPQYSYELRFFGSRASSASAITEYAAFGANEARASLLTGGDEVGRDGGNANDSNVAVLRGVKPDAFGQIFVDLTLMYGSSAHLNAMEITASAPALAPNYAGWRSQNFSAGELGNPALEAGVWGSDADPDGDGNSNLLEYASGGNPRVLDFQAPAFALESTAEGNVLSFTYRRNLAATDVRFQVQCTEEFGGWQDVADTAVSSANGVETRRATVSRVGYSQRWLRLKVELNQ